MELIESRMLSGCHVVNIGPEAKENNLLKADEEYRNGNLENSIYYQVRSLYQSTDLRYLSELEQFDHFKPKIKDVLINASKMEQQDYQRWDNKQEENDYQSNKFFKNILENHKDEKQRQRNRSLPPGSMITLDFMEDITNATDGVARINDICQQLPDEWCIIQLTKSYNPSTTYSLYNEINSSDSAIYLAILRHCRSPQLGHTCLKFDSDRLVVLFQQYSTQVERFRKVVSVNPVLAKVKQTKQKYWEDLQEYSIFLQQLINDFREIISPYEFLFLGKRYKTDAVTELTERIYQEVDAFCDQQKWNQHQRILLSQAALHANRIKKTDLRLISIELASDNKWNEVYDLLNKWSNDWLQLKKNGTLPKIINKRFPTILVVDERLDHFHWEQLVTVQEFSRAKSLHLLWRLYQWHKPKMKHGFYAVNIDKGLSVINPDGDLVNSGRRLRGFFEYWLKHWQNMFETIPTEDVMIKQAFKADCFVYAGHGTGLQYVSGRTICRSRVESIVFLFGCDSTRLLGTGLYSAMYGGHDYYHGALCPTIVGTLMPALDANMDTVSVSVLSQFLAPWQKKVIPWSVIDRTTWIKTGVVQAENIENPQYMDETPDYQMGSLCAIISQVQQGLIEPVIFNSCIYVCRGLPAWNLAVQKMPF